MITIGMMMIKACPNQIYQEKEDEVDLMFADIEPEDEWQDKVRCLTKFDNWQVEALSLTFEL